MSPAELPERPLVGADESESESEVEVDTADVTPAPEARSDVAIDRIQSRLDDLQSRIAAALPEGYDLAELIKASGEGHETEDVFDITGELYALDRLAGPLIVPGMTPPPAFDDDGDIGSLLDAAPELPSARQSGRWKWVLLLIVLVIAVAAAAAVVLGYI